MSSVIMVSLLGGLPLLVWFILRVHTSALFISIAAGYLLSSFVGETAGLVSKSFITDGSTAMVTKIVVFFLPIVMTAWIMRKSLSGAQMVTHLLPMIGCAALILVLGIPLLSEATQATVYADFPGSVVRQMADAIVGIAVALQLILMWITARPRHAPPKRAHHRG